MSDQTTVNTATKPTITLESIVARGEEQVSTLVDGEVVLMNVSTGTYFQLDSVASRVWSMIETPVAAGAVCERLLQEFAVERRTCEADVLALLDRLAADNLVRVAAAN